MTQAEPQEVPETSSNTVRLKLKLLCFLRADDSLISFTVLLQGQRVD